MHSYVASIRKVTAGATCSSQPKCCTGGQPLHGPGTGNLVGDHIMHWATVCSHEPTARQLSLLAPNSNQLQTMYYSA